MKKSLLCLASLLACFTITSAKADVIADWTFQSALSTNNIIGAGLTPSGTQSGVLADIGTGTASASHATAGSAWSSPAGNGSTNSWSVNNWSVGDYFQFQVSTLTFQNINVSFDQTSSGTGPRDFGLYYSTNGTIFTQFGANYSVLANAAPNTPWSVTTQNSAYSFSFDLSAITALNNSAADYFRPPQSRRPFRACRLLRAFAFAGAEDVAGAVAGFDGVLHGASQSPPPRRSSQSCGAASARSTESARWDSPDFSRRCPARCRPPVRRNQTCFRRSSRRGSRWATCRANRRAPPLRRSRMSPNMFSQSITSNCVGLAA